MKTSELIKLLKRYGIVKIRSGGRHDIYYSPITGAEIPIGRHSKEVPVGTVQSILKAAGLKWQS